MEMPPLSPVTDPVSGALQLDEQGNIVLRAAWCALNRPAAGWVPPAQTAASRYWRVVDGAAHPITQAEWVEDDQSRIEREAVEAYALRILLDEIPEDADTSEEPVNDTVPDEAYGEPPAGVEPTDA